MSVTTILVSMKKEKSFFKRSQITFSCLFLTVSEPWLCTFFAFPCFKRKLASQQKPKSDVPLWCSQVFLVDKWEMLILWKIKDERKIDLNTQIDSILRSGNLHLHHNQTAAITAHGGLEIQHAPIQAGFNFSTWMCNEKMSTQWGGWVFCEIKPVIGEC